ncbi:MAG TPA: nitronate monooxygenase [Mycobacteriales bacterium]|nr:nitronate monooxygenase [Mycobacteriales bacterium]
MTLPALTYPVLQAPMAGDPSTPALTAAVSGAGGLGFLAAGYKTPERVGEEIAAVRKETGRPFGVNVFVPGGPPVDRAAVDRYVASLAPEAARYGVPLGEPRDDDDHWAAKLDLLVASRVPVVSFTFGCPDAVSLERLRSAGILTTVTVTSVPEARLAAGAGADVLCVQGVEAGGHRGTFADAPGDLGLLSLLGLVRAAVDLPLIAAGGIMTAAGVRAVLAAGAVAAQCGTAFLLADEAGTSAPHRAALGDPAATTTLTRAFSGRWARGIRNRFLDEHADAPAGYPAINHVTRPLRAAAAKAGDAGGINLWAGQAFLLARAAPAATILASLAP